MKEPVVYTGDESTRVARTRRVYQRMQPPGSILQRDRSERSSQIFLRADELHSGPLLPANNTETIVFQSDPTLRIKLAKLHQAKKEVQAEIKVLRQKISKHEYARVVRRHTTWTRGWVAKRPRQFELKPRPAQYTWVKRYHRTELLSREEWLKRMLQLTTLRVRQRKDYESELARWAAHPEWVRRPYRYWYSDPYWIRVEVLPAGALGTMKVPIKEFKQYPRRRWDLIRRDWSRRLNSLRPRIDKLQARLDGIRSALAKLYSFTEYKPMVYTQDCEWAALNREPLPPNLDLHLIGMPGRHRDLEEDQAFPGGLWLSWYRPSYPHPVFFALESVASHEIHTTRPARLLTTTAREFCWLCPGAWHTVQYGSKWTVNYEWKKKQLQSTASKEVVNRVINLDDIQKLEQDLEDKMRIARLALLNLRLGRDVIEFNPFRSLLEQKDIPSTFRAGRDFFHFMKGSQGQEYFEVITSSGHRTMLTVNSMSIAQRATLLKARKPSDAALRAVGLKRAVKKVVTKRTKLATLAGLYLAWKFAIAPTRSDIETTLEKGWDYVLTCRRGLDQLIRRKGLHFWEDRSLYRTFRVGNQRMLDQHSHKQVFDLDIPVAYRRELRWHLSIPLEDWQSWLQGEIPSSVKTIHSGFVYETTGDLHFWFPAVRTHSDLTPEYLKEIDDHNLDQVWSTIPERYQGSLTFIRQILRGKIFAKFSAKELLKGLGDGSIRSKIAWANLYKSAWDLLPCSFVTEWFTNLGEVATATNDLANAMITGLNVSKKTWASLSSSVFANAPVLPSLELSVDAGITQYSRIWSCESVDPNSIAYVYDVVSQAEGVVRVNADLPQTARQLRNTAIRTSVRRVVNTAVDTPSVRLRVSITPPQAGSLAAMLLSGG